jgi:hypothetical protein
VASWAVLDEQRVWITPWTTSFTVLCDACAKLGDAFTTVQGSLELDVLRATIECPRGHRLRVEREGR